MKRCISCGEIGSGEDNFCRKCGSSYLVHYTEEIPEQPGDDFMETDKQELAQTKKVTDSYSCAQFIVGWVIVFIGQIIAFFLGYFQPELREIQIISLLILLSISLLLAWLGVIGWKGKFSILHFIGIILISYVPIIGGLVIALFVGRGVFVLLERKTSFAM